MYLNCFDYIDHRDHSLVFALCGKGSLLHFDGDQSPEVIAVNGRAPLSVPQQVIMAHPAFPEITRMVSVDPRFVVMFGTGHTTATGVFVVITDSAKAHFAMTALLPRVLGLPSERHLVIGGLE